MEKEIQNILNIQRAAWKRGHENYGSSIDVKAAALHFLQYFKHLNPAQKKLEEILSQEDDLKYAKRLCSRANKSVRHYIVTLK
ncbi:hypothetical protein ACX818_001489 [Acinetobacter baumannii]